MIGAARQAVSGRWFALPEALACQLGSGRIANDCLVYTIRQIKMISHSEMLPKVLSLPTSLDDLAFPTA